MHPSFILRLCLIALGLTLYLPAHADPTVGVRAGGGEGLRLYSLFGRWQAPWLQEHAVAPFFSDRVQAYWDLSVERWEGEDTAGQANSSEVYIVGPVLRVNWPSRRLFLLVGVQPSYMTHSVIDDDDMGGNHPIHQPCWSWPGRRCNRLTLGLRGQHTSNSRLYKPNPGMNLASVTLAYNF
ncbi:MAG TPA: hypothetical protein DEB22_15985 [Alcanivorax sp.]|nr:hypothetical protein [Alcanivorax sp.]